VVVPAVPWCPPHPLTASTHTSTTTKRIDDNPRSINHLDV
jgi:hypothetical protein